MQEYLALGIFAVVYALIIGRRRFGVPIWAAMLIGAALMVALQIITPENAAKAINLDVIGFLFGMFTIVTALDKAGVLQQIADRIFSRAHTSSRLLLTFVVGMGSLAAFLVNDTIALLAIPLVIYLSRKSALRPQILFLGLAFGITVGSVMTPIGNPQNLLIAIQSGISAPFITFLFFLGLPTITNLFVTYGILRLFYRRDFAQSFANALANGALIEPRTSGNNVLASTQTPNSHSRPVRAEHGMAPEYDNKLARISTCVLLATIGGFIISEVLNVLHIVQLSLSAVALLGAASIYAFSKRRVEIMQSVDYSVLIFFAAMFVVTAGLWESGAVSNVILRVIPIPNPDNLVQSTTAISLASIGASQILSNVPFVAIYDSIMINHGIDNEHIVQWMMLAAASTIAGNLTILGAASNIIILESAESRGVTAFRFVEFLKVGSLVTAANLAVYYLFLVFI